MRLTRVVAACVVIAGAAFAAGAWSSAPPTPTEKRLTKDVAALKSQVKVLQSDVKVLTRSLAQAEDDVAKASKATSEVRDGVGAIALLSLCGVALAADGLQGTWQVIDQLSAATRAGAIVFGPQAPADDTLAGQPACQSINVTRSQSAPPTIAPFSALLAVLRR